MRPLADDQIADSALVETRLDAVRGNNLCASSPGDHGQARFVSLGRPISSYWEPFRRLSLDEETLGASEVAKLSR